jgi:hypothetical protein
MSSNRTDMSTSGGYFSQLPVKSPIGAMPQLEAQIEQFADQIFTHHVKPNGGVLLAAEEVLRIASLYPVTLQWRDGDCHIRIGELGETKRPLPVSYFRALLARLSTLFSEGGSTPSDWNSYLGQGTLTIKAGDSTERILEMNFENTQQRQFAQLTPIAP